MKYRIAYIFQLNVLIFIYVLLDWAVNIIANSQNGKISRERERKRGRRSEASSAN